MTLGYLTIEQAAEVLQRHQERIVEQVAIGELPTIKLPGNGWVVPLSAVLPYSQPSEEEG